MIDRLFEWDGYLSTALMAVGLGAIWALPDSPWATLPVYAGLLMLMTILLIAFAPVAWLFSQSTQSLPWMGLLHLLFWLIATIFGVRFLSSAFAHSNARSSAGLNTWVVIFMLVALQMSTALRPIIGLSDTFLPAEKKFFVSHWFDCIDKSDANRTR